MASGQMKRTGPSGTGIPYSTLIDAGNYLINTMLGKTPPPKQREAYESLTNSQKKIVKEAVAEELPTRNVDVAPVDRLTSIPSATRSTSGSNPPRTSTAGTPTPERRPSRPSTVDTESTSLGRRVAESLMEDISDDAKETKRMEEEREMNVAGRKKGGMVKKKKAPVKKAYGGMVKKKKGGMASRTLRTNTKAGFTRRGCSKG